MDGYIVSNKCEFVTVIENDRIANILKFEEFKLNHDKKYSDTLNKISERFNKLENKGSEFYSVGLFNPVSYDRIDVLGLKNEFDSVEYTYQFDSELFFKIVPYLITNNIGTLEIIVECKRIVGIIDINKFREEYETPNFWDEIDLPDGSYEISINTGLRVYSYKDYSYSI